LKVDVDKRSSSALAAISFARANRSRFVAELNEFVRFPSVSADPARRDDAHRCAQWLAGRLQGIGLGDVRLHETTHNPLVTANWLGAPGRPTLLIYGHYDVQPTDPLDEWRTPPFEPEVRGDYLFGRGASDDKGQLWTHIKGIESLMKTAGGLPVNVRCLFEGDEEVGSHGLMEFLKTNPPEARADLAVISDMAMLARNRPALTHALRGVLSFEITVRGPARDLHSGMYGGVVQNPLEALCDIVAKMHAPDGRIAVPGVYDHVRDLPASERRRMAVSGPSDQRIADAAGIDMPWGSLGAAGTPTREVSDTLTSERARTAVPQGPHSGAESGYSLYERLTVRPSLTVNGLTGGYQGPGSKSVIPAKASAKLSMRLVPDQDPLEIKRALAAFIARIAPPGVRVDVVFGKSARPTLLDRKHPGQQAAARALRLGFGVAPVFLRSGGTVPVAQVFQEKKGMPTVLMGFGLRDDRMHAPNERFLLANLYRGIETSIWFLHELAAGIQYGDLANNISWQADRTRFPTDRASWHTSCKNRVRIPTGRASW
jgi:acetylornithine deacetylase/succinyl-diaminopimelate desuccinylase-like protein